MMVVAPARFMSSSSRTARGRVAAMPSRWCFFR